MSLEAFTFYLWKMDASTGYMPKLRGKVTLEGTAIRVDASDDPHLEAVVHEVSARPDLPFKGESMEGEEGDRRLVMHQEMVRPGQPQYGLALSQAICRAGQYTVSFTPEPV